jgi:hypothetical protein
MAVNLVLCGAGISRGVFQLERTQFWDGGAGCLSEVTISLETNESLTSLQQSQSALQQSPLGTKEYDHPRYSILNSLSQFLVLGVGFAGEGAALEAVGVVEEYFEGLARGVLRFSGDSEDARESV